MQTEYRGFATRSHARTRTIVKSYASSVFLLVAATFVSANASVAYASDAAPAKPLFVQLDEPSHHADRVVLMDKARTKGSVRVRVGLRDDLAEDKGRSARSVERAARMAQKQNALAARILGSGSKYKTFKASPFVSMTVTPDQLDALMTDSDVDWVRETVTFSPSLEYSRGLVQADALFASEQVDGSGYAIAVIDTGVDGTHPMLAGKIIDDAAACFSGNFPGGAAHSLCSQGGTSELGEGAGEPCDLSACWHGTHVASIAGGGGPLNGIARGANIIPIKAVYENNGMVSFDDDDLYAALVYVYSLKDTYKIGAVNISLQGPMFSSACDVNFPDYAAIFALLRDAGIAPVVSSGNMWSDDQIAAPGCLSNAISVAATTKSDRIAEFSNFSKNVTLVAPGEDIHAALPGGLYGYASGTSMAAPHVAGAIAVLKQEFPDASVSEITEALVCSGKSIERTGNKVAKSRIDLVGSSDALAGESSNRRWRFSSEADSYDWASLRGDWSIQKKAYYGQPAPGAFVASMLSTCAKTVHLRARMKLRTGSSVGTDRAGMILNPAIDYRRNTISGYWLSFANDNGGSAAVLRINRMRLDGRRGGSVTEICKRTAVVRPKGSNLVEAQMTETGFSFSLNGSLVCQVDANISSGRVVLAARIEDPSPEDQLIVGMVQVGAPRPDSGSDTRAAHRTNRPFKAPSYISVVRQPLVDAEKPIGSAYSMYEL